MRREINFALSKNAVAKKEEHEDGKERKKDGKNAQVRRKIIYGTFSRY